MFSHKRCAIAKYNTFDPLAVAQGPLDSGFRQRADEPSAIPFDLIG
jgi:hypothetical protein